MRTQAIIDGVPCTLEVLDDGCIRVTHQSQQVNGMHGPATAGEVMFVVHPVQQNQYDFLRSQFPADQEASPSTSLPPWWSYSGAAREKRDKRDRTE